jgi:hypothetical protein
LDCDEKVKSTRNEKRKKQGIQRSASGASLEDRHKEVSIQQQAKSAMKMLKIDCMAATDHGWVDVSDWSRDEKGNANPSGFMLAFRLQDEPQKCDGPGQKPV